MGIASFIQSPWEAPHLDGFSQIYEKRHFSGKWHFSFLFSSKSMNITMGTRMIFFHHLGLPTKAAPDIWGTRVRTPRTWRHFFKMNGIFWPFLALSVTKGKKGKGMGKGPCNQKWVSIQQYIKIILSSFLLRKLFQENQNEWKFCFDFGNFFFKGKKN